MNKPMCTESPSKAADEIEVTPEMAEAGFVVFGPFDRNAWETMDPSRIQSMLVSVYTAMRAVEAGLDVKQGIQAGLERYPFPTSEPVNPRV